MARRKQSVPTFAASSFSEEGATDSKRQRLEIKDEPFNVEEYEIHSSSESEPSHSGGATDLHEPRLTSSGYSDTEQALSSDGASAALAFNDGNTSPLSALRNLSGTCAHQVPIGGAVNHYGSVLPNQHDDVNQAGQQRMPAVPSNVGSHDGLPANSDDLSSLECSFRFKVETEYPVVTCLRGNSIDTGEEINMFKCHLCNKMFMTLSGVQQHLALHVAKDITRLLPEAKLPPPDDTPSAISGRMPSASDSYSKQLSSRQWSSPLLQGHGSTRALQCDADERSGGRVPLARRDEGKQQAEQPDYLGKKADEEHRTTLGNIYTVMKDILQTVQSNAKHQTLQHKEPERGAVAKVAEQSVFPERVSLEGIISEENEHQEITTFPPSLLPSYIQDPIKHGGPPVIDLDSDPQQPSDLKFSIDIPSTEWMSEPSPFSQAADGGATSGGWEVEQVQSDPSYDAMPRVYPSTANQLVAQRPVPRNRPLAMLPKSRRQIPSRELVARCRQLPLVQSGSFTQAHGPSTSRSCNFSRVKEGELPHLILNSKKWDVCDPKKGCTLLAIKLAVSVFGTDVLAVSSPGGKNGLNPLDPDRMQMIKEMVQQRFSHIWSPQEFELQWKRCVISILQRCKFCRNQLRKRMLSISASTRLGRAFMR